MRKSERVVACFGGAQEWSVWYMVHVFKCVQMCFMPRRKAKKVVKEREERRREEKGERVFFESRGPKPSVVVATTSHKSHFCPPLFSTPPLYL